MLATILDLHLGLDADVQCLRLTTCMHGFARVRCAPATVAGVRVLAFIQQRMSFGTMET